ncbi:restriction endonuclease subunit S [Streptomyces sp. NPDC060333]|uniref:restriction endonuclease subunit S n=1 Tax=Streptomyces sp. NPDC060333 TaxID=3347098 RepID=UPI00364C88CF
MELPEGWERVRLDEIADVRLGRQRSPKNHTGDQMRPYIRAANVGWDGLKLHDVKEMNFTESELATYRLEPGDIVLSEASGSPGEVGKPALWNGEIENCCFQNTLIRVRAPHMDPKFLLHFLRYEALRGGFVGGARGVGIHHLGAAKLSAWEVAVPPLAEQKRIVEALEVHLSHLDSAVSTLRSSRRRLEGLRKTVFLDLVPEEPPSDWRRATVEEAGTVELGRARHPDWHNGPEMRPYLRVANVFEDRIDASDVMEMDFTGVFEKYKLHDGDVLLNEGQSPHLVGRPALYRGHPENVAFTNSILRFKANSDVLPEWALMVFRRHLHARRFMREVRITTNIAHLSAKRLKVIEFPIPSLEVQKERVARCDELLTGLAAIDRVVGKSLQRASGVRKALLRRAFSGGLVGQDPTDEPASALLSRVQAERVVALRPKRTQRASAALRKTAAAKLTAPAPDQSPAPTVSVQQELPL